MNKKILILGDLFLDIFTYYDSYRSSPEFNVPVLINKKKKYYLGGSGNVAANLKSFNEKVVLVSFFNNNQIGKIISRILKKKKIESFFLKNKRYISIIKNRIICNNLQIARIDNEKKTSHTKLTLNMLNIYLKRNIKLLKAIIISDYNKGFINNKVMKIVTSYSKKNEIPIFVDPKKSDPKIYKGANFITPNFREFKSFYLNLNYKKKIKKIFNKTDINYLVVTNGSKGAFYINKNFKRINFKGLRVVKKDVSGAGDTFLASLVYSFLKTKNIDLSMNFSNKIASDVVKIKNIATPRRKIFQYEKKKLLRNNKKMQIDIWKKKNFKIGVANGCFDLYHEGHKYFLGQCKKYCDKLVVLLNTDSSIKINKGIRRPVEKLNIRYNKILKNINVDKCITFSEKTPLKKIKKILPNIILKGGDYNLEDVVGYSLMKETKGKVHIIKRYKNYSTTNLINFKNYS